MTRTSFSIGQSIAIAVGTSTAASMGAVWALDKHPRIIAGAVEFVAKHVIYPCEHCLGAPAPKQTDKAYDPGLLEVARRKATLLVKGALMMGVGFATHIPTQLVMEGKLGDMKELRQVVMGKSLGLGVTLMTGWLAEKVHPGMIDSLEHTVQKVISPTSICAEGEKDPKCPLKDDFCKLLVLDIPSSVCSGLVNYCFSRGRMH
jgi:hypothetical protein